MGIVPKPNGNIVETPIPNTHVHIHDCLLSWLGTSIKKGWIKPALCHLSETSCDHESVFQDSKIQNLLDWSKFFYFPRMWIVGVFFFFFFILFQI